MALTIIKPSGGGLGLSSPGTAGNVLVSTGTGWASQEPAATGPKITNIQITNSSYTVLDDTAVSTSGGYIKITGSGFLAGAQVVIGTTNATSIAVVSSTVLNVQVPALSAGTYTVYVVNTDGSVGIRVNGLTYSGTPTWVTGSTLPQGQVNSAISIQLSATGDPPLTYALQAGSSLPSGLTLTSGGLLSGTVTGITVETTYNFTIEAIDPELQESPRAFSITITATDQYFPYVSLLLSANTPTTSTFVKDASTNNFNITVNGDTRPNNFGPYTPGYYSNFFDGNGDNTAVASNAVFTLGLNDFSFEAWIYPISITNTSAVIASQWGLNGDEGIWQLGMTGNNFYWQYDVNGAVPAGTITLTATSVITYNTWQHVLVTRTESGGNSLTRLFVNGVLQLYNSTSSYSITSSSSPLRLGMQGFTGYRNGEPFNGYISNFRFCNGSIPTGYTTSATTVGTVVFTPSTEPLTTTSQGATASQVESLLAQSNRFIDNSTNNFAVTVSGNTTINGFDPFVPASNTATYGSGYFDGTGDWLSTTCGAVGTGDFALECWVYPTVLGSFDGFVSSAMDGGGALGISISRDQAWIGNNSTIAVSYNWSANVVVNRWVHLAVTRQGTSVRFFVNGDLLSTGTASTNINSTTLAIGRRYPNWDSAYPTGYISNVRLVIGDAVYTASFTPSTSPLTAISGTSLLTLQSNQPTNNNMFVDNSTNNFLVTRNGNTTQGTFSPYAGTWSNYFDGTGDYLFIPNSSTLLFGSGNFTVETWVYPTTFAADRWIVGFWSYTNPANQSWALYMNNSTGGYGFVIQGDAGAEDLLILSASNTVVLNQWTHVAVTRSGSSWRMFINGVQSATGTYSGTLASPSSVLIVAGVENVPQLYIGYISNLRVVKGTAVYTSNFNTPTQPLTPITNTTLLICADNRFVDDSMNNFTITRTGDVSVQKFSPFSMQTQIVPTSYSVYFDGTGDYLSVSDNEAFNFTGDFTIECWLYPPSHPAAVYLIGQTNSTDYAPVLVFLSNGRPGIAVSSNGSTWTINGFIATALTLNTWSHVAVVRSGNKWSIYVNGVENVITASTAVTPYNSTDPLGIGSEAVATINYPYVGYISNLRIVKGTAVYTANFTPPTAPLTAITNTSLLTCQSTTIIDNSTNNFTITVNGNSQPLAQNPFGYTNPTQGIYTTTTLGGSMYFDGTGDYLIVPPSPPTYLSNQPFTIETWVYPMANNIIILSRRASVAARGFFLSYGNITSNKFTFYAGDTEVTNWNVQLTSADAFSLSQWYHIAVTRNSSNLFTLWVNGVSQASSTASFTIADDTSNLQIGTVDTGSTPWNGYIADLRIIPGQAQYASPFVPPIAPLTAIKNSGLLLNGTSGGIVDSSMVNDLETVADTRINNSIVKFSGTNSIYFDGTGDYMYPSGSGLNFTFRTGDFTIEMWCYFNSVTGGLLYDGRPTSTNGVYPAIYITGGSLRYYVSTADRITSGTTLSTGVWYHIALSRSGTSTRMFIDGTQTGSTYTDSNNYLGSTNRPVIGISAFDFSGSPLNGYISDVRVTNGIARYTSNFTAPTSPFIQY